MRATAVYERMTPDTIKTRLLVVVRSAVALCAVAAFFWAAEPRTLTAQSPSCRVTTANGDVQGALRGATCTYLSIPYAAAPTANLRWRPPQPRAPWAPIALDATLQRQLGFLAHAALACQSGVVPASHRSERDQHTKSVHHG